MDRDIHLSIVSHSQMGLVNELLRDISRLESVGRLQITIIRNVPENISPCIPDNVVINIIDNLEPAGFSCNHNFAFLNPPLKNERRWFGIVNPDIRIKMDVLTVLAGVLEQDRNVGVVAPRIVNGIGKNEDSARVLPTLGRLLLKVAGMKGGWPTVAGQGPFEPDWIAGMFMLFSANAFEAVGMLDEGYYLYYEDVDICCRFWLDGYRVRVVPDVYVVHDARRQSHRDFRYARWHIASMGRFLRSDVRKRAQALHRARIR